jgi:CDP-diacylglycerol--serine O-phosphatidyltransferase
MLLKTKDYFTLGNAFSGFMSVIFVIRGDLNWAAYWILIAEFFDVTDGLVARITKQFNKFGAELDNVADLISYSVAPAFLVYGYFTQGTQFEPLPWWLAALIASAPLLAGCIRFARFNVKRLHFEGAWFGFPRPAAAFLYIGWMFSHLGNSSEVGYYLGIVVVLYASLAHFILIPFYNHHRTTFPLFLKVSFWFIASSTVFAAIGHAITGINLTWDVVTFWLLLYLFVHRFLTFSPKERAELKEFVKEWKKGEADV